MLTSIKSECNVPLFKSPPLDIKLYYLTRCTRSLRVVFSVTKMRSSNSAHLKKIDFTTEKIGSVHMTVFEIVAPRNVNNWIHY